MPTVQSETRKPFNALKISIIAAISLLFVSSIAFATAVFSYTNVYPNVTLCGTPIGRMTREQAISTATQMFENASSGKKITINYQKENLDFDVPSNFSADINTTIDKAFNIGRNGNLAKRLADILAKNEINFDITKDEASINSQISNFAEKIQRGNNIFELLPKGDVIKVDLTKNGVIVDIEATRNTLLQNAKSLVFDSFPVQTHTNFTADDVDLIYKTIQRDPINATCTIVNNKPVVEPHKVGISFDKAILAKHLSNGEKIFEIPVTTIAPKITTDQFQSKMFADVLGEQTTSYNSAMADRTQNVMLAAKAINGITIAPGRDFSFNQVVGERTYERGFKDATVFVGGKAEQGAGGGICQVSSTLYSAQLLSDLQTVKRANHQFTVTYMPAGQDATVAYGVQDYVFRNNTAYPVKIVSTIGGGKLTIKILGTKTDKDLKISIINNTISTRNFEEKTEVSSDVAQGKTVVKQKGQDGATVDTYKIYSRNGVEEKRVFLHRSVYNPMEKLIQVSPNSSAQATQETQVPKETTNQTTTPEPTVTQTPTSTPIPTATPKPSIQPTASPIPTQTPTVPVASSVPTSDTGI